MLLDALLEVSIGVQQGCTTIVVPGWAAVGIVLIAAAPRIAQELLRREKDR